LVFIHRYEDPGNAIYDSYNSGVDMTDYLMGFYLGITILTTVGYGDANGKTEIQRIIIIIYIFIGVSLYSLIIQEFSNMIFNTDQDSVDLEN
jgi:hypothetical protein